MQPFHATRRCFAVMFASALVLSCGDGADRANNNDKPVEPEKLSFAFQKQKEQTEQMKTDAEAVGKFLSDELGIPVNVVVPGNYEATVTAFNAGKLDIAYTDSIPYLYADHERGADILVAEVRSDATGKDRTDYDSIFVAAADSDVNSLDDVKANAGDLSICFTSRHSTSGFVMAYKRLVNEGIIEQGQKPEDVFKSVSYGGNYAAALQEVAAGRADVCAVSFYTMEGPKAEAAAYIDHETQEKLKIIARTPGVPTHVVFCADNLSDAWKRKISDALLKLSNEKSELLADVYGAKQFVKVEDDDAHVAGTIEAFKYLEGVGITTQRFMDEKIKGSSK